MNNRKIMFKLCLMYTMSFISFALPMVYLQVYLEHIGYDVMQRGIILSGSAVVTIVAQFIAGYLCDKYKTNKLFYNLLFIIIAFCALVMYNVTENIFFIHLIFTSLVGGLIRAIMAIQDAWTLESGEFCKQNYGSIRAFGALGWMVGSPIGSMIIVNYGYSMIPYVFLGLTVINVLYAMSVQDAIKVKHTQKLKLSDLKELSRSKNYVLITLIFLFVNIISAADMYTIVDKMIAFGAGETMIGAKMSIQAFTELPLFFAGAILLKKFGSLKLLRFGICMYIIRFIGYALAPSAEMILVVALLQCVTFPLIMITSKTLIDSVTPSHLKSSGQTIASSVYVGIALLITPIISGGLISTFGVNQTLYIFGFLGIVPLILTKFYK